MLLGARLALWVAGSVAGVRKERQRLETRIIPGPWFKYSQSQGQKGVSLTPTRPSCHQPPQLSSAQPGRWVPVPRPLPVPANYDLATPLSRHGSLDLWSYPHPNSYFQL